MQDSNFLGLIISLLPQLSLVDKIKLFNVINNIEELYIKSKTQIENILEKKLINFWDIMEIRDKADRIDTMCRMRSLKWVSWADGEYPPLLREIYDPPAVLYYRGRLPNPEKCLLGMVGTRKPSPEAAMQCFKLACGAGNAGISVVSGLAYGIDAMAHRGNLSGGVPGYAVLGSGIDEVYPSAHRLLAKQILDSGGALISEYPPGVSPAKWTFPARNRIISALSRSVIIAEAPEKSGALITANFALEQGKELWVASSGIKQGSMLYDRRGTIKLAQDGADVIFTENDIMDKWNMKNGQTENGNLTGCPGKKDRREIISSMADFLKIDI